MFNNKTFLVSALVVVAASSQAAVLYEIISGPDTSSSSVHAPGGLVGASGYEKGDGLNFNASGSTFNVRDFDTTNASFQDAIDDNEVITWNFVAELPTNLTSYSIRLDRSSTGPGNVQIEFRDDTPSASANFVVVQTISDLNASGANFLNVDMSQFQGILGGTFRLSAYGASSAAGTFDFENTTAINPTGAVSFQLNGEAVPEPMTMVVLAGLGAAALRRRKNG